MPEQAVETAASSIQEQRFLICRVGAVRYALRAEMVLEIMVVPPLARVPHGPKALLGIGNLRGSVMAFASLQGLLNIQQTQFFNTMRAIVIEVGSRIALVVDTVDTLAEVAIERIGDRHSELSAQPGELLLGAFQADEGDIVKILDIKTLLGQAFTQKSDARERHVHRRTDVTTSRDHQLATVSHEMLVTFDVAGQEFALDLDVVQEVLPAPAHRSAMPRAESLVLGVTSLRGALLPLLSLRGLLGFPANAAGDQREKVIVMKIAGTQVGLLADAARDVLAAESSLVDAVPPVLAARMGGEARVRSIYRAESGRRLISILAPEQLFKEDVMQRLRSQSGPSKTAIGSQAAEPAAASDYLVFSLGDAQFALPIGAVVEVALVPNKLTSVPKTPKFLEGVINLRGSVVPVIDQRRRFDMPEAPAGQARRLLVVKTEAHRAGLIVDSVSDVLRVPDAWIEAAPDLTDEVARLVRRIIKLENSQRIILLLDPLELLTRVERGLLDEFERDALRVDA